MNMQEEKKSTQVGPGQAGESHTAPAVSPHRIMGGASNCTLDQLMPRFSARPAAVSAPTPQAATNAPINPTAAATNAPMHLTPAAIHAPVPTTVCVPPTNLWQQSIVRSSTTYPDSDQDEHRQTDTGKDTEPGSSTTLPVDVGEVRPLIKRGKTSAREKKEVGDRKRTTREGTSQREARSDAEEMVRDQSRVRAGATQRAKLPDAEPRAQPQVREGETQRGKRPDVEPSGRGQVREGATQREAPPHAVEPAGAANRPQDPNKTHDRPRPRHARGKRSRASHKALPATTTLPGTSEPQPGPSGTGPTKRERPDDTASPSTFQGDAKRVRVHSAQGGQRTYARATQDIPARLAVAICFPHPGRELTKVEAELIKTDLENLVMDTDMSAPLPAFRGYPRVAEGTVQMWCEDDNALTWLTQNVPKIKLPDTDQKLTVMKQTDVPTRVRASLFVPRYRGDVAKLQSVLIRQNTWYDISRWSLYRATTVGGDHCGTYLTLGLPPEEAEKVLGRERRISYMLGSIYVRFWPRTRPSDTQTDSTDGKTTVPTTTQTTDTDIAQLEEVMARAAMADDTDTLPPASPGWNELLLASSPGDECDDRHRVEETERQSNGSISD